MWWEVAPRYTPGSPALVPRETALRVAAQEHAAYLKLTETPGYLKGGQGLSGIVWSWWQRGSRIEWRDEITHEVGTLIVRDREPIRWPWART